MALNESEVTAFLENGFVLKKALFSKDEVDALNTVVNNDPRIQEATYGRIDASGATTELALWTDE